MAIIRVDIKPELLLWACDRAGDGGAALRERFANLDAWIQGEAKPTLKQLEDFAKFARVAVGYLFLPEPPVEKLPIRDLRTLGGKGVRRPSPDLLDVLYLCQQRQEWYREYAEQHGEEPAAFLGSAALDDSAVDVAAEMRRILEFDTAARRECSSPSDLMRLFIERAELVGILVMVSGVVKNSTNRVLDPEEFRGFALVDPLAPIIFVNGADSKPAQMFTLAHELAHLWLGESALSNVSLSETANNRTEKWCNQVAAEFLVPLAELKKMAISDPLGHLDTYKQLFKVSRPVILRRLLDATLINRNQFGQAYAAAIQQANPPKPKSPGGDFYNTLPVRASKRFVRALVASTSAGQTLYRDAFQLLGITSVKTLRRIGQRIGGV
jgi:Zn-dependent peptidase ImmA (M78 family)